MSSMRFGALKLLTQKKKRKSRIAQIPLPQCHHLNGNVHRVRNSMSTHTLLSEQGLENVQNAARETVLLDYQDQNGKYVSRK